MAGTDDLGHSDAQVVASSLENPEAFSSLFERHSSAVFKFLSRQSSPAAAGDLLADTFVAAFRARHRYDMLYSSAKPWLLGIAANIARHHRRSEARYQRMRARLGKAPGFVPDETARAEETMDAARQRVRLGDALGRVSPAHREVILLFASFDLSYEEISHALGVPVGTVRSRLSRARRELRKRLGPTGQYEIEEEAPRVAGSSAGDGNG